MQQDESSADNINVDKEKVALASKKIEEKKPEVKKEETKKEEKKEEKKPSEKPSLKQTIENSWTAQDDKEMDEEAKRLAGNENSVNQGSVKVALLKEKNQSDKTNIEVEDTLTQIQGPQVVKSKLMKPLQKELFHFLADVKA